MQALRAAAGGASPQFVPGHDQRIPLEPFRALSDLCRARALCVAAATSRYVTPDEKLVLAGLAVQQRRSSAPIEFQWPGLGEILAECARSLIACGYRLTLNAAALFLLRENWLIANPPAADRRTETDPARTRATPAAIREGTAKWEVIEHVRHREVVTSAELQALGITRQYISLLRKDGILERVSFGNYRLDRDFARAESGLHR